MLNYIWAGLIVISLVFALASDTRDKVQDRYRNDDTLAVTLVYPEGLQPGARTVPVEIRVDPERYREFYGVETPPEPVYRGTIVRTQVGVQLRFDAAADLPPPLDVIHRHSASGAGELQGVLVAEEPAPDLTESTAGVVFNPVTFDRIKAITEAAFSFADTAASLALGLIGVLALFLGLLQIAQASGIITSLVRVTQPLFRPLFPEIPDGHPALGMIVLNLTANMLGLGNAATPLGIKAMEELQALNPKKDTATNSMVMLLAMNTASVQLVPPTLLVAIMGLQVGELILPIIVVTGLSLVVAVSMAKWLQRMRVFRRSDPALTEESPPEDEP